MTSGPRNASGVLLAHKTRTGVMTSAPARSPSHHVSQIAPKFDHWAKPANAKLTTPMVGLNVVARRLMSVNGTTWSGLTKVSRPPDQRLTSQAPLSASSMLPTLITAEVVIVPAVVTLAANAPSRIAGATRYPRSNTAASASPVAGQIGVALALVEARKKPIFASAKKIAHRTASSIA